MKNSLTAILCFLFLLVWAFGQSVPLSVFGNIPLVRTVRLLYLYIPAIVPILLCLRLLKRFGTPGTGNNPLGLDPVGFGKGFLYAALCVMPMFVGYALTGSLNRNLTADGIITGSLLAGFFEELFFRAFLFGFLFRYCRWGFIPAVFVNGLFFGAFHLYQGYDLLSALASFGVTFGAAVLYSWIYTEWKFNLWTVVWLHALMNLSWMIFSVAPTAAGNLTANIFRIATIILSIVLTVIHKRRNGEKYAINGRTLLINNLPLPL